MHTKTYPDEPCHRCGGDGVDPVQPNIPDIDHVEPCNLCRGTGKDYYVESEYSDSGKFLGYNRIHTGWTLEHIPEDYFDYRK